MMTEIKEDWCASNKMYQEHKKSEVMIVQVHKE